MLLTPAAAQDATRSCTRILALALVRRSKTSSIWTNKCIVSHFLACRVLRVTEVALMKPTEEVRFGQAFAPLLSNGPLKRMVLDIFRTRYVFPYCFLPVAIRWNRRHFIPNGHTVSNWRAGKLPCSLQDQSIYCRHTSTQEDGPEPSFYAFVLSIQAVPTAAGSSLLHTC